MASIAITTTGAKPFWFNRFIGSSLKSGDFL